MYKALYNRLPGGTVAKVSQMVALAMLALAFLFFVAFPFVDSLIATDPSINA